MDRFIVAFTNPRTKMITDLKSNMDRFIAFLLLAFCLKNLHLKSNMDRFIAKSCGANRFLINLFKIQYG